MLKVVHEKEMIKAFLSSSKTLIFWLFQRHSVLNFMQKMTQLQGDKIFVRKEMEQNRSETPAWHGSFGQHFDDTLYGKASVNCT